MGEGEHGEREDVEIEHGARHGARKDLEIEHGAREDGEGGHGEREDGEGEHGEREGEDREHGEGEEIVAFAGDDGHPDEGGHLREYQPGGDQGESGTRVSEVGTEISEVGPSHRDEEEERSGEIVILVVADEKTDRLNIVSAIKRGDPGSWKEQQLGKVRIHSRQDPFRKIIEPTSLGHIKDKSPTSTGRRWISENSLRRIIANKQVIGIFVITTKIREEACSSSISNYDNCWVDVLTILFGSGEQKKGVFFVVKHSGDLDTAARRKLENFIRQHDFDPKNIVYSESGEEVMHVLEQNVGLGANGTQNTAPPFRIGPFYLHNKWTRAKRQRLRNPERYTVWSSEGVILLGRAGSGKSTLAQMLTTGKLDPGAKKFSLGGGLRVHTRRIEEGEGRGWYVVDSPGFGEPVSGGTVSTTEAQRILQKFVYLVNGTYAHYLFVMSKDRVDQLDVNLWKFFKVLFGEELLANFSIIISNADKEWVQMNWTYLSRVFKGCKSFIPVIFPTIQWEDIAHESSDFLEELLVENESMQRESLQDLEDKLARLRRWDRVCAYGKGSRISRMMERDGADSDVKVQRSLVRKMINQAPQLLFGLDERLLWLIHRFTTMRRLELVEIHL